MDFDYLLSKKFSKEELLEIAEFFDIKVNKELDKTLIVDLIRRRVLSNGLPDEISAIVNRFIEESRWFDNSMMIELEDFSLPQCFSNSVSKDCHTCLLYNPCSISLFDKIPDCFGIKYDYNECESCILQNHCTLKLGEPIVHPGHLVRFFYTLPYLDNVLLALSKFRSLNKCWPTEIVLHKYSRIPMIKIRDIKIKLINLGLINAIYLGGIRKEKECEERQPLIFEGEWEPFRGHIVSRDMDEKILS